MSVTICRLVLVLGFASGLALPRSALALATPTDMVTTAHVAFQDDDDDDFDDDDFDDDDDFVPAPPPAPAAPAPAAPAPAGPLDDDDDAVELIGNDPAFQAPIIDDDDDPSTDGFRAGQVIVQLAPGADIGAVTVRHGAVIAAAIPAQNLYLLGLPSAAGASVSLAPFEADPAVAWAELNYAERAPEGRPGRFFLSAEAVTPEVVTASQPPPSLGIAAALACVSGAGVVVAVLDTGVDAAHPELAAQVVPGGWNVLINSPDTRDLGNAVDDDGDGRIDEMTGHGTHVAGIVAQVAPAAGIMPIKVLDSDGVGDAFYVAAGIYQAIGSGADVINLSLGSTHDARVIAEAVTAAHEAGIMVAAAAGNADREAPPEYPAIADHAFGIAATDGTGAKSDFSNYHALLFLSAPGTDVVSTFPGGGYARWSGTSMATPWVAGAAALALEQMPDLTPDEVGERLAATAAPIPAADPRYDGLLGAGVLDVGAAIGCRP